MSESVGWLAKYRSLLRVMELGFGVGREWERGRETRQGFGIAMHPPCSKFQPPFRFSFN